MSPLYMFPQDMGNSDRTQKAPGRHGEKFWQEEKQRGNFGLKMMEKMGWNKGQGLGKDMQGSTIYVKSKKREDNLGIGADAVTGDEQDWKATQGMFNELLAKLNKKVANPNANDEDEDSKKPEKTAGAALQGFVAKRTLYGRFKRAKDTKNYSKTDMAAIFGKSDQSSSKASSVTSGYQVPSKFAVGSKDDKGKEFKSDIQTSTSSTSIRDYFAKKMAAAQYGKQKVSASGERGGFTEDFQESYFNQMTDTANMYKRGKSMGIGSGAANKWGNSRNKQQDVSHHRFVAEPEDVQTTQDAAPEKSLESKKKKKSKKSKRKEQKQSEAEEIKKEKCETASTKKKKKRSREVDPESSLVQKSPKKPKAVSQESEEGASSSQKKSKKKKKIKKKLEKNTEFAEAATPVAEEKKSKKKKKKNSKKEKKDTTAS